MLDKVYDFRFHHLSYALLFTILPLRALNFFGAMMSIDSMGWWITNLRGGVNGNGHTDYMNVVLDYMVPTLLVVVCCSLVQMVSSTFFEKKEEKACP